MHKTKLAMKTQHPSWGRNRGQHSRDLQHAQTVTVDRTLRTLSGAQAVARNGSAPAAVHLTAQPVGESIGHSDSPAPQPDHAAALSAPDELPAQKPSAGEPLEDTPPEDVSAVPVLVPAPKPGTVVAAEDVPQGVYSLGKRDLLRQAWHQVRTVLPDGPFVALERVAFIDAPETDTQVWLSVNRAAKQVSAMQFHTSAVTRMCTYPVRPRNTRR